MFGNSNGATGHNLYSFKVTNGSRNECVLAGFPEVIATEPGSAPVQADDFTIMGSGGPGGPIRPREYGVLVLETRRDCEARFANSSRRLIYRTLVFRFGGGEKTVSAPGGGLDVLCGLGTQQFTVRP